MAGASEGAEAALLFVGSRTHGRVTFVRTKVTKNRRGDPGPPFFFPNRSVSDLILPCHWITKSFGHLICGGLLVRLRLSPC